MTGRASATGKPRDDGAHVRAPHRATFVDAPDEPTTPDLLLEDGGPRPLPGPGERIRQYEVIRELGREGSSAVLAARDLELGRKVAIKLLLGDVDPVLTARFLLGAKATARCRHENVIAIHEVGEHGGNPFVVLEHLQGAPLTQLLQDGRKLPPARAVELMVPVVRALAVAHAHNLIHGDLKPDKIFVTDAGTIKVLDLGLARLVHGEPREATRRQPILPGGLVEALPYLAPEQWGAGGGVVDLQTDLWSVGIMLFELVAGRHPLALRGGRDLTTTGILEEPMPGVRGACPAIPDELADVIDRCLEKPKDRRFGSARELLDALEPLLPGRQARRLHPDECPYAGLAVFEESDAHLFFGRAREVAAAVARLREVPLLGIVGPRGVGTSSFVRAGVVPALEASGEPWSVLVVRPGRGPMAALASALAPLVTADPPASATAAAEGPRQEAIVDRLYAEPGFLGAALRGRARSRGQHLLLFVDQLEELYTQGADARERLAFTACLAGVCDDAAAPLRLVLSLRSELLDDLAGAPALMAELTRGLFFLTTPGRDGLRDALIQPAELAGYRFESPQMIESMLDHLEHAPGALPLLQFAASQLWELRDRERRLFTSDSYDRIGGIANALASHADAVVAACTAGEQALVRALFLRLVTPERTRAIVPVSELRDLSPDAGEVHRAIDRLVRSRLVVSQTTAGESGGSAPGGSLELAHASLIHGWPLLQRWLDEAQEDAAFLELLFSASEQWQAEGYAEGLLWRGEAMQKARLWHGRYRGELPELQRAYLAAVFSPPPSSLPPAERRGPVTVTAAIGLLSALVVAAAVALVMIRGAEREATARARRVEEQLELTRAAEAAAKAERAEAVVAKRKLERTNAALVATLEAAEHARAEAERARVEAVEAIRLRAEEAKRREQRSRRRAAEESESGRAGAADAGAKAAGEKLEAPGRKSKTVP